jgi:hypothetical protein
MKKLVPDTLLTDREEVQLSALSMWALDHDATEIVMTERQLAASLKQLRPCQNFDDRVCLLNVLA